ncbi:MAG: DUF362 domain-containing protein [Candidatus Hydrothermarchaeales archaeon]
MIIIGLKISKRKVLYIGGGLLVALLLKRFYYPVKYFLFRPEAEPVLVRRPPKFSTKDKKNLVGVVKGSNIQEMVEESLELIGGIEQFGVNGKEVLVKPNVNSDDPHPATTNPEVIKAVVNLLYKSGAEKVKVGDMSNPSYIPTIKTMEKLGIKEAAEEAGAEVISFDDDEWLAVSPDRADYLLEFLISRTVYEAEKIVSVPVIKTHSIATYTMSLKNFVGVIHPNSRARLHRSDDIEEMIAEINLAVHPDFIIMDGTKSMIAGGPMKGSVRDTNLILASADRVAMDLVGLGIVKSFGEWPRVSDIGVWDQRQIRRAVELNLGATSSDDFELVWKTLNPRDSDDLDRLMETVSDYIYEV